MRGCRNWPADLVRRRVAVIAANGPAAASAKTTTTAVPIVFTAGVDPVAAGLVASLNRPGGNLTGVTSMATEVGPKRLELLRELLPTASVVALLVNPTNPLVDELSRNLQSAAQMLRLRLHVLHASSELDLDGVFAGLHQLAADGLVITPAALFNRRCEQLAQLSLRHAIPTIFQYRAFAEAGGLMSYGANATDSYLLAGSYTGRILKGEKPSDLPVHQATKVELIINLKTARTLGLTVPLSLRGRADEVIE